MSKTLVHENLSRFGGQTYTPDSAPFQLLIGKRAVNSRLPAGLRPTENFRALCLWRAYSSGVGFCHEKVRHHGISGVLCGTDPLSIGKAVQRLGGTASEHAVGVHLRIEFPCHVQGCGCGYATPAEEAG